MGLKYQILEEKVISGLLFHQYLAPAPVLLTAFHRSFPFRYGSPISLTSREGWERSWAGEAWCKLTDFFSLSKKKTPNAVKFNYLSTIRAGTSCFKRMLLPVR